MNTRYGEALHALFFYALALILMGTLGLAILKTTPQGDAPQVTVIEKSEPVILPDLEVTSDSQTPPGWSKYCLRNRYLGKRDTFSVRIAATEENMRLIRFVHDSVNAEITYQIDYEQWKENDVWSHPDPIKRRGDCEDYALEKRRRLMNMGFPPSALLVAIVEVGEFAKSPEGSPVVGVMRQSHAVLLVKTDAGEIVLDMVTFDGQGDPVIRHPSQYQSYRFLVRQSVEDPNRWVRYKT